MFPIVLFMIIYIVCLTVDFPGEPNFFFFCLKRKLGHLTELLNLYKKMSSAISHLKIENHKRCMVS